MRIQLTHHLATVTVADFLAAFGAVLLSAPVAAQHLEQRAYIKSPAAQYGAYFGHSVDVEGDTLVVGAPELFGSTEGAVLVLTRGAENWAHSAELTPSIPTSWVRLGAAVAIAGDRVVASDAFTGAHVFQREGGDWVQEAHLQSPITPWSTYDVAIDGDHIVVGGRRPNGGPTEWFAFVYSRRGGTWELEAQLEPTTPGEFTDFGRSVAIHGDLIAVGARSANAVGEVDVYRNRGGLWLHEAVLVASNPGADWFGSTVDVYGDTIAVAAPREGSSSVGVNPPGPPNNSATRAGAAYVFRAYDQGWTQEAYVKAFNTDAGDTFGTALAIHGDRLVVSAALEGSDATGSTAIRATVPPAIVLAPPTYSSATAPCGHSETTSSHRTRASGTSLGSPSQSPPSICSWEPEKRTARRTTSTATRLTTHTLRRAQSTRTT